MGGRGGGGLGWGRELLRLLLTQLPLGCPSSQMLVEKLLSLSPPLCAACCVFPWWLRRDGNSLWEEGAQGLEHPSRCSPHEDRVVLLLLRGSCACLPAFHS